MAQIVVQKPMGAIEVYPDTPYTGANIPAVADYVICLRGVRIKDEKGEDTRLRGLRMTITNDEVVATSPIPNVPYIWLEGTELKFDSGYSYKFHDRGIVGYGLVVAI